MICRIRKHNVVPSVSPFLRILIAQWKLDQSTSSQAAGSEKSDTALLHLPHKHYLSVIFISWNISNLGEPSKTTDNKRGYFHLHCHTPTM